MSLKNAGNLGKCSLETTTWVVTKSFELVFFFFFFLRVFVRRAIRRVP